MNKKQKNSVFVITILIAIVSVFYKFLSTFPFMLCILYILYLTIHKVCKISKIPPDEDFENIIHKEKKTVDLLTQFKSLSFAIDIAFHKGIDSGLFDQDINLSVDRIVENLIHLTRSIGPVNNDKLLERVKMEFIMTIFSTIINDHYKDEVIVKREYRTKNKYGKVDRADAAIICKNRNFIIMCIEAKRGSKEFKKGFDQNKRQVYNSYMKNLENGLPYDHSIYGIVTTGHIWSIGWYKGYNHLGKNKLSLHYQKPLYPIETIVTKEKRVWKNKLKPLIKIILFIIMFSISL